MYPCVQVKAGVKVYKVNNQLVEVSTGSEFCRKCGRRLTNAESQRIGYGPECQSGNSDKRIILAIGTAQKVKRNSIPVIRLVDNASETCNV